LSPKVAERTAELARPGHVVAGKYRVVRVLGRGGMGLVVEAVHLALNQRVAIKFHQPQQADDHEQVLRFTQEAKAAAQIRSEHVVRVTDVAELETGVPYMVMEYMEGRDLDRAIVSDGPIAIETAVDYALQACEALAEAHSIGIVHRDLKPANLFLAKRSDRSVVVKLLDFGISKQAPTGNDPQLNMTSTTAFMGSPLYMAPEQMRSMRTVDHRADIWSMGIILHEMLTGETPFDGESLTAVCAAIVADGPTPLRKKRPDAPPAMEAIILRCLEKDPERRYADVAELADALAPFAPPEADRSVARVTRIVKRDAAPTSRPVPLTLTKNRLRASPESERRRAKNRVTEDAPPDALPPGRSREFSARALLEPSLPPPRATQRWALAGGALLIIVGLLAWRIGARVRPAAESTSPSAHPAEAAAARSGASPEIAPSASPEHDPGPSTLPSSLSAASPYESAPAPAPLPSPPVSTASTASTAIRRSRPPEAPPPPSSSTPVPARNSDWLPKEKVLPTILR